MTAPCCPCDEGRFPPVPSIPPGLSALPPQVVGFPEYRQSMLAAVRSKFALGDWRAREGDDLGLMVFEWWAYVFDIVEFYGQQITQNFYLRTATHSEVVRGLTGLIGYRPRPAVAAEALLAAIVEAGPDVVLPASSAFRSEAFGDEPPQVFESEAEGAFTFRNNRWRLAPVPETESGTGPLLMDIPSMRLVVGAWCVISWGPNSVDRRITAIRPVRALDGGTYAEVTLSGGTGMASNVSLADIRVRMSTLSATSHLGATTSVATMSIVLNAQYPQLLPGQDILVVGRTKRSQNQIKSVSLDSTAFATKVELEWGLPAELVAGAPVEVFFGFVDGGRVVRPAKTSVEAEDLTPSAALDGVVEPLATPAAGPLLVQDRDHIGLTLDATVSASGGAGTLTPPPSLAPFAKPLVPPIDVYGNVFRVVRGETVAHEVLGSGDASAKFQSFKLKKKPLTYVASGAAPGGRRASLEVSVNGVRWTEVESFFGHEAGDEVYVVRQNDDLDSLIIFWRLPSGVENVVARYRFGAGAAKPPVNGLTQLVRPARGLRVVNPVAPWGGADADQPADIRKNAPATALALGRAVSLADFEALARGFGVVNVSVRWAWDAAQQRAVVKLWYVADGGDPGASLRTFLTGQADPNVPIVVAPAVADARNLLIDLVIDPRRDAATVRSAVVAAMTDPERGLLAHANVPIGGSIFRSALVAAASAVPGVVAINGVTVNNAPAPMALTVAEGHFLDFLPFGNE